MTSKGTESVYEFTYSCNEAVVVFKPNGRAYYRGHRIPRWIAWILAARYLAQAARKGQA